MKFHPGQAVWYVSGKHIRKGNVVTGDLIRNAIESRVEIDCEPDRRIAGRNRKLMRLAAIVAGERIRCRQEIERCKLEISTDEGALIGMADWARELKALEVEV